MPRRLTPQSSPLDNLRKEAKRWLKALGDNVASARSRLERALPHAPDLPTLRDVQLALAREHGFPGWTEFKRALMPDPEAGARTLQYYEMAAASLLDAYRTGTPAAMAYHYLHTWHRREWAAMRTYVQLDLGKRPDNPGEDVEITLDDARRLVAREHGFANWDAVGRFVAQIPGGATITAKPMRVRILDGGEDGRSLAESREWATILSTLAEHPEAEFEAQGQVTDSMLAELAQVPGVRRLQLSGCKALTDDGVRHLAHMPELEQLDLGGTAITDASLGVIGTLAKLKALSLGMTRVTDSSLGQLEGLDALESLNLMWTGTGDAALKAMAGKPAFRRFKSGNGITDAGLVMLHDLPVFKEWQGGEEALALMSYDAGPNSLLLRGPFTDNGMRQLEGLDGLFALNLDDRGLGISAAGLPPLATLPNLGWLAVDARDDWMPWIARMPRLRFLGCQDTVAGDDGFVALSQSRSIERIWGRRCHNLRTRGFMALAEMPVLHGLSVSCLNVEDAGIATLPNFPALRELMPMDIPDAGYRHVGKCAQLESLILMYCRETTDAATEQITGLDRLSYYFNSYTTITDRTPQLLSHMDSLERITFDACHALTNDGVAQLARLPRLRELRLAGAQLTPQVVRRFPSGMVVKYFP